MRRAWGVGAAALLALVAVTRRPAVRAAEAPITFAGQVAPILYARCTTCHHPGGAGPFSLMTYKDAQRWGPQILTVTQSRYMPPWLPEPGFGEFADDRRLPDKDREMLRLWVAAGMPQGEMAAAPKVPVYTVEWELGPPDLVLEMPQAFTTPAEGTDVFRNFVLPTGLKQTAYVRAMEIRPGSGAAVHHANVVLDRTGSYRRQHPDDWRTGVPGMELAVDAGNSFDPDSHFLFWKPDSPAIVEPAGLEWRLDPGDDLILNMHLKPTGKPEPVRAKVGLYFSKTPPTRQPMLLQLEHDGALDIPAGERAFAVEDELKLPVAVTALGVYPHAHYLGKRLEAWAMLSDGRRQWLVSIRDWDIDRQSVYRYRAPVLLPAGTTLHMRFVYDNSAANPHNPHTPPVRVRAGNRSEDEMGHLWLQVLPVEATVDGNDARLLLEQAWMRDRLRKDPDDPMALYNLAAAEGQAGHSAEAVPLFRRILARSPDDARTLTALGVALDGAGDWREAVKTYQRALALRPEQNDARFDLAQLELTHERYAAAAADFGALVQRVPDDAAAHAGLGAALAGQDQREAAHGEFVAALGIDPHLRAALEGAAECEMSGGDMAHALEHLRAALAEKDSGETRQRLALAYLQVGRSEEAADELRAAIRLDPADAAPHSLLSQVESGRGNLAGALEQQEIGLKLAPNDADGWNNLGVLHARSGRKEAARRDFERALALVPGHAQAAANLKRLD